MRKRGDRKSLVTLLVGKGFSAIKWKGEEVVF
jgi:hypothetical protein